MPCSLPLLCRLLLSLLSAQFFPAFIQYLCRKRLSQVFLSAQFFPAFIQYPYSKRPSQVFLSAQFFPAFIQYPCRKRPSQVFLSAQLLHAPNCYVRSMRMEQSFHDHRMNVRCAWNEFRSRMSCGLQPSKTAEGTRLNDFDVGCWLHSFSEQKASQADLF